MGRVTARRPVVRRRVADGVVGGRPDRARPDTLAVEEPLEVRVGGRALSVTMRTPGDDFDLVAGLLLSEGIIRDGSDLLLMRYCAGDTGEGNTYNVLDAVLGEDAPGLPDLATHTLLTTSSCGICGSASLEAVRRRTRFTVAEDPVQVAAATLAALPARLRSAQRIFDRTGGLHAAGLFTADGELLCAREDVGRHNAVDKVLGWAVRDARLPLAGHVLQVSGRVSFELVQKAVMAGVPFLSAVSAPSSLAVDLALEEGLTLAGFVRDGAMNLYAAPQRVV